MGCTVRRECLDRVLILGRRHLLHVLAAYASHYNEHRPHRALRQRSPFGPAPPTSVTTGELIDVDRIRRQELLGGLVHEYRLAA
jgi:hypothetical protein